MKKIVFDIRCYGTNSLLGTIIKHFGTIPESVLGWENPRKKDYEFYIIVPDDAIEECKKEIAQLQLRKFVILSNKGMIIGG
jgi:hypothetical protein